VRISHCDIIEPNISFADPRTPFGVIELRGDDDEMIALGNDSAIGDLRVD
jgi:hypothetical protein